MTKRTVAAVLWLLAVWTVMGMVAAFTGMPSVIAPAVGLLVAALVWRDPTGRLWNERVDRARIQRRLADLPRVTEQTGESEQWREADATHG